MSSQVTSAYETMIIKAPDATKREDLHGFDTGQLAHSVLDHNRTLTSPEFSTQVDGFTRAFEAGVDYSITYEDAFATVSTCTDLDRPMSIIKKLDTLTPLPGNYTFVRDLDTTCETLRTVSQPTH